MNIIAENITRRRKELNMTQRELADKLNVSDKTVSRWETGKQVPDALMMPELAKSLNVSIDELYGMNRATETRMTEAEPIQEEKVTLFKLVLLIATSVYFFINFVACLPFGTIPLIMVFGGIGIVLFAVTMVFHEFYKRKANASYYELENFKWLGIAVLFADFIIAVWVPLIKNYINYSGTPLLWITFVAIVNILLLCMSIWYRSYLRRKAMTVQKNTTCLPIAIGVMGSVVVISCKLFQTRNFQASTVVLEQSIHNDTLRLFELGAGILFVLMQVVNYMLLLHIWKNQKTNTKVVWGGVCAFAICSIVSIGWNIKTHLQDSLYNELAKHAIEKEAESASIASVSIGVNFGVGQDVYTYFTLEQEEHIEQLFDLFHDIKVEKGEPEEKGKQGRSCRIRFEHYIYEEGKTETLSWDVTLMESGEMWYRGETYRITNVDWDELCRLAVSEYNGGNKDFYEELLK